MKWTQYKWWALLPGLKTLTNTRLLVWAHACSLLQYPNDAETACAPTHAALSPSAFDWNWNCTSTVKSENHNYCCSTLKGIFQTAFHLLKGEMCTSRAHSRATEQPAPSQKLAVLYFFILLKYLPPWVLKCAKFAQRSEAKTNFLMMAWQQPSLQLSKHCNFHQNASTWQEWRHTLQTLPLLKNAFCRTDTKRFQSSQSPLKKLGKKNDTMMVDKVC